MIKFSELLKAVALITVFSLLTRALGFVFRIYLSWELGAEMLGIYQVAMSVVGVLLMLVSSGLPLALSKMTAIYETKRDQRSIDRATTATLIVSLALSALLCLLIFAFDTPLENIFADSRTVLIILTLLPSVIFSAVYSSFRGTLWGKKNYFIVGLSEFIEQVMRIVFFFLLAYFVGDALSSGVIAGVSLSIACVCSALVVVIYYFAKGNRLGNPHSQYRRLLKSATPVTGVRVATSALQPIIAIVIPMQLVLAGMSSENALAEFGIAVGMTMPLLFVPSMLVGSVAMVLLPELSSQIEQKNKETALSQINMAFTFSIFISMLIIPLYMGMWRDIGLFVYNNERAGLLLAYSAWLMIPLALSNISSTVLNALNLEGKSFVNYFIGAVVLIVAILALTRVIGIASLIVGTGACMIISSALNIRLIRKRINAKVGVLRQIIVMGALAVPSLFFTSFTFNIFDAFCPKFFALALGSVCGAASFVLLCVIFKAINLKTLLTEFAKPKKGNPEMSTPHIQSQGETQWAHKSQTRPTAVKHEP